MKIVDTFIYFLNLIFNCRCFCSQCIINMYFLHTILAYTLQGCHGSFIVPETQIPSILLLPSVQHRASIWCWKCCPSTHHQPMRDRKGQVKDDPFLKRHDLKVTHNLHSDSQLVMWSQLAVRGVRWLSDHVVVIYTVPGSRRGGRCLRTTRGLLSWHLEILSSFKINDNQI